MKINGLFITGTDTDVGKTYIACQIIGQINKLVDDLCVRKPIESGCQRKDDNTLIPADGTALCTANGHKESLETVTPLRFEPAIAPDRAAGLVGSYITTKDLTNHCLNKTRTDSFLFVEGAGGFYSPLCQDGLNADLAKALNLPVVLVVADKLGCINHTLLTLLAIEHAQLPIAAVVLNLTTSANQTQFNHRQELAKHVQYPIFECPKDGQLESIISIIN